MKKYLVEFVGTLFLSMTVATAAVYGSAPLIDGVSLAPIAIGLVYMAMIYSGGHVSGGHFNPAVTLGSFVRGRCEARDVGPYIISQVLAAFVGGVAGSILVERSSTVSQNLVTGPTILAEFLFTFALVYVVLNTTTAKANAGNSFYGLAIGGTLMAGVITVGEISIGSFNPAISVMLGITGALSWVDSWMHFLPQLLAAVCAAYTFKAICPEDV